MASALPVESPRQGAELDIIHVILCTCYSPITGGFNK